MLERLRGKLSDMTMADLSLSLRHFFKRRVTDTPVLFFYPLDCFLQLPGQQHTLSISRILKSNDRILKSNVKLTITYRTENFFFFFSLRLDKKGKKNFLSRHVKHFSLSIRLGKLEKSYYRHCRM